MSTEQGITFASPIRALQGLPAAQRRKEKLSRRDETRRDIRGQPGTKCKGVSPTEGREQIGQKQVCALVCAGFGRTDGALV